MIPSSIQRLELSHDSGLTFTDLSLLSPTTFMVPVTRRNSSGQLAATLDIYDFSSPLKLDTDGIPTPRLLRTFFLPAFNPTIASLDFTCCSSLTNRRVWARSEAQTERLAAFGGRTAREMEVSKPFRPLDEDRLCALILEAYSTPDGWTALFPYSYVILTTAKNLLRPYPEEWVPWTEWGGENAACLHGNPIDLRWGNCWYPHGLRIVVARRIYSPVSIVHVEPPPEFEIPAILRATPHWRLEMFDFNPDRVRRFAHEGSWPPDTDVDEPRETTTTTRVIREPFLMGPRSNPKTWAFRDWPIAASLPFLRTSLHKTSWDCDWVEMDMDSERVLLVKVSCFERR